MIPTFLRHINEKAGLKTQLLSIRDPMEMVPHGRTDLDGHITLVLRLVFLVLPRKRDRHTASYQRSGFGWPHRVAFRPTFS